MSSQGQREVNQAQRELPLEHTFDCSACVRGAAGDRGPESWVSRGRVREDSNLLGLSLSWAVWERKGLQRGRKANAPGVKAQPVQQAGDPVWINEREGDN